MNKKFLLILQFFFLLSICFGQDQVISEKNFSDLVLSSVWSVENKDHKEEYEMMVMSLSSDTIIIGYVNWLVGGGRSICEYGLTINEGIFQLEIEKCSEGEWSSFVYGYLMGKSLQVLFSNDQLELGKGLKSMGNWIQFEPM